MPIETLVKTIPLPAMPHEAFDGPWAPVEARLGTALPQDYKDFVRLYGCGYFMAFMGVYVPRSRNAYVLLEHQVWSVCGAFRGEEFFDAPVWPAPGGLLPFGGTDNGDYLFWRTEGAPDMWRVVVWDRGMNAFETFDCDLTDFLAGLATGRVLPTAFPELLPCDAPFAPNTHERPPEENRSSAGRGTASLRFTWAIGPHRGVATSVLRG